MWSLGVVLYELLTGVLPFEGQSIEELMQNILKGEFEIPEELSPNCIDLLQKMICVDMDKRINCEDFLQHSWI